MSNNNSNHHEDEFIEALFETAQKFLRISAVFCSHKIGKILWNQVIISFKNNIILEYDISLLESPKSK